MVARVTLAEVDVVRNDIDDAVDRFRTSVVPALREQDGFEGVYVLTTPAGKAVVMTFWESEQDAERGLASGY
jgi:heme-degrading monooxygenase HmoA